PAGLASIMVQVISRPILLYLTNEETVGIFQANFKLGIFMMLIVSMFEYAWRPFFLNNANDKNAKVIFSKVMLLFVGITSIVLITLTYFIEDVIKIPLRGRGYLIGSKYWSGVYIVPVVLFGYLIYGIYINLMAGIYIEKKTKYLPYITGLGALINICGNFILIPLIGIFGAALSSFLSFLAMTVYIYKVSQRFYPVAFEMNKIYIINCVNIIALVIFYYYYYQNINIDLMVKIFFVLIFITPIIFISRLWKIKYLITNY
ncbi:MAG: polysaccharide biosynthesis C-terminal domain-containing protein, partial [Ignavibacteria bacterium]